ncbi:hypothetical protein EDD15DRAFT_2206369 [Pisolithus albus]|nr:hypothetical protein EDD15DRAFT_2206369 [Pisolithus albus]
MPNVSEVTGGNGLELPPAYGRDGPTAAAWGCGNMLPAHAWIFRGHSSPSRAVLCSRACFQAAQDQPVRLASDTDDEEVFFFPRAPSQPTAKHEHDQSPLSPQHSPNSSIPSSSTRSTVPIPIPLVGPNEGRTTTGPLTPKSQNHLTDPTTGKIILGAVSEAQASLTTGNAALRAGLQSPYNATHTCPYVGLLETMGPSGCQSEARSISPSLHEAFSRFDA